MFYSELLENEYYQKNRLFSSIDLSNVRFWYSEGLLYSERKREIEKLKSYTFKVLVHVYMIKNPLSQWIDATDKNINDVYNSWIKPMVSSLLKLKQLTIEPFNFELNERLCRLLEDELIKNHKYPKNLRIDLDYLMYFWTKFLVELLNKMSDCKRFKKEFTKEDLIEIINNLPID